MRNFKSILGYILKIPSPDDFWALNDVTFKIKKGEVLGIIGPNGAGKSTILKILANVTKPSKGNFTTKGRIGALIEIGAGLQQDLTGKENIYLYGTILGMSKKEINKKFNEIVEFSELKDFLNTPVKFYSSGMYVKLGFSVTIFTEPDILLVDEVLSVGDMRFQKKCIEKIKNMQKKMAIVFVSHRMRHVYRLCERCLLLNKGIIEKSGPTEEVINTYIEKNMYQSTKQDQLLLLKSDDSFKNVKASMHNWKQEKIRKVEFGKLTTITVVIESKKNIDDVLCSLSIFSQEGSLVTFINTENFPFNITVGNNILVCSIKNIKLVPGIYSLKIKCNSKYGNLLLEAEYGMFEVHMPKGVYRPTTGFYIEDVMWKKT